MNRVAGPGERARQSKNRSADGAVRSKHAFLRHWRTGRPRSSRPASVPFHSLLNLVPEGRRGRAGRKLTYSHNGREYWLTDVAGDVISRILA